MAKMRLVVVEIEGAPEAMLSVIRDVAGIDSRIFAREAVSVSNVQLQPGDLQYVDSVPLPSFDPPAPKHAKAKGAAKRKPAAKPEPARSAAPPQADDTCRAQVYTALKLGPKTSGELIKLFPKYSPASIYLALKELRASMVVKTEMIDGEQRNVRVA